MHCAGETLPAPCYLASDRKQSASALYGSHTRIVLMQNFSWGEVVEFFPLRELKSSMRTIRCTQDVRVVHSANLKKSFKINDLQQRASEYMYQNMYHEALSFCPWLQELCQVLCSG